MRPKLLFIDEIDTITFFPIFGDKILTEIPIGVGCTLPAIVRDWDRPLAPL